MLLGGWALAAALAVAISAQAWGAEPPAPVFQAPTAFPTPTPNANGNVIYVVQEGDTAWRIAAVAGISLEELYALNGLKSTDFLTPGMQLTLAQISPTQLPASAETSGPPTLTPTPVGGTADICVLLFVDQNGNASLDEGEPALAGGQISVADPGGTVVGDQATTDDPAGHCFAGLEMGDYNVSAAVPSGYNPTTSMNTPVRIAPGDVSYVEFGAQPSAALGGDNPGDSQRSLLLGILGISFLVAAGALGYIASRYNRHNPMSLR
jgi:LysM repeat protein